jgi:hypothetical protein
MRKGKFMDRLKAFVALLLIIGTLDFSGSLLWAAEGIILKNADPSGQYCHFKFPAITEETLFSDRPVLKSLTDGDIIDFYGPCSFDPLGKESVLQQRADLQRERRRQYDNSN